MKIQDIDVANITPYAKNPRKNDKAVDTVVKSLEQYGFQQPIVVDKDHVIIVGHTRFRAAKKLGFKTVPVLVADNLTERQAQAYRIMDNRSNENAQWDNDLLITELQDLLNDTNIQELANESGYTESELNRLFKGDTDKLDALKDFLTPKTTAKTGDVWILGDHRIICGDSTNPEHYNKLLQKDKIDLLWEDPPYGVAYVTANGINHSEEYRNLTNHIIENDTLTKEELDVFLQAHTEQVNKYIRPGASVYWCHDIRFNHQFKSILEANKFHISDTLIWRKNNASNWLSNYAKYYEPILYGWKEGAEHKYYGKGMNPNAFTMDDLESKSKEQLIAIIQSIPSNYQEFSKEPLKTAKLHPTVKPVKLIAFHIINSSKVDEIVFDGFSGSGSTLIACETTGRRARCIELEEKFVDVTIRRWQELTGLDATRESDGVTFYEASQTTESELTLEQEIDANLSEVFGFDKLPKETQQ